MVIYELKVLLQAFEDIAKISIFIIPTHGILFCFVKRLYVLYQYQYLIYLVTQEAITFPILAKIIVIIKS